jgi:hypothetical protein
VRRRQLVPVRLQAAVLAFVADIVHDHFSMPLPLPPPAETGIDLELTHNALHDRRAAAVAYPATRHDFYNP